MILLIDNYDSFVYNLARYVVELGQEVVVKRNDQISITEIKTMAPTAIIISPGPKAPNDAGISLQTVQQFAVTTPILGVCLGHQAIAQAFGGKIIAAKNPMHGKAAVIKNNQQGIFANLPPTITAGRYHSLAVSAADLPSDLIVTATSDDDEIMALCHRHYPCFGVQFHPESVLTPHGHDIIGNFVAMSQWYNLTINQSYSSCGSRLYRAEDDTA